MKRLALVATFAGLLLLPGVARAGAATDAALGLGAFAVFNQILGGVGVFARPAPVVVASPPPVVYAPPPPVVYAPPPPVVYAPPPVYVAPQPVYVAPRAVYVAPRPVVVYRPAPVYYHRVVDRHAAWCPPGQAKKGRCGDAWYPHH